MIEVEQAFNDYVKSIGGELVSELLPKSPNCDNADYLFRKNQPEAVIVELKCLTKDLLREGYQEKLDSLFDEWVNRRLIPPFWGQHRFMSRNLPQECQRELFSLLGTRIKKDIHAASKQIKQTKSHFGLNDAKGLLLLVNDGNYSLESNLVLHLTDRAFRSCGSGINSIIYFTVNMTSRVPGIDRDVLVWVPAQREGIPSISHEFLDWLRDGWLRFYERMIGEPVPTVTAKDNQLIEQIKFVQPPEPNQHLKPKNRAAVNLRHEIAKQLDLILSSCRLYDAGKRQEAIRIANAAHAILHGSPNSRALIREYFGDHDIKLRTTTMICVPPVPHFFGFLGLEINTGEFRPMLDDTGRNAFLPFNEWWVEPVLKLSNENNETVTRKEIILAANKDGGVPISTDIQAKYARLEAGLGIKSMVRTVAGQDLEIIFRNANLAALRQIGHELLRSEELMALAR
jgi:hypothetical protein